MLVKTVKVGGEDFAKVDDLITYFEGMLKTITATDPLQMSFGEMVVNDAEIDLVRAILSDLRKLR
jgi:hypothetical protein